MKLKHTLAGIMAGAAACLALAAPATAQVSADELLDKLVAKGILTQDRGGAAQERFPDQQPGGRRD